MRITKSNQKKNEKKNFKKVLQRAKRKIKGITLIALVVTIIILLILAGVALSLTVGDNGLFRRAQNAADTWQMAEQNEQSEMDKAADFLERYENGNKSLNSVTGEEITNSIVYDKYGNKVVVPAGFKVINPEDDVTNGIVIEDVSAEGATENTKGSQFVWIPVGNVYIDEKQNYEIVTLGRYKFDRITGKGTLIQSASQWNNISDNVSINLYKEYPNSDEGNVSAKNLEKFITKTIENKGYYVGRFEAGDEEASEYNTVEYGDSLVVKQGVWTYVYVTQSQAAELSRNMYNSNSFESDLINSYAWDTAIVYIQKFSGDEDYSIQNRIQTTLAKSGTATDGNNNDLRCNIYDLAGNVKEWSTETYVDEGNNPCTLRGGWYYEDYYYVNSRNYVDTQYENSGTSFRVILYLP